MKTILSAWSWRISFIALSFMVRLCCCYIKKTYKITSLNNLLIYTVITNFFFYIFFCKKNNISYPLNNWIPPWATEWSPLRSMAGQVYLGNRKYNLVGLIILGLMRIWKHTRNYLGSKLMKTCKLGLHKSSKLDRVDLWRLHANWCCMVACSLRIGHLIVM